MKWASNLFRGFIAASVVVLGSIGFAQDVEISAQIDASNSGDYATSGTRLRVLVHISDNFTTPSDPAEPSGVALTIDYPTDSVSWGFDDDGLPGTPPITVESADDPDDTGPLQPWGVVAGNEEPQSGDIVRRRISTVGTPIGPTPDCFYVNFTVGGTANNLPYDLAVGPDNSGTPVAGLIGPGEPGGPATFSLTPVFDNTGVQNITTATVSDWTILD